MFVLELAHPWLLAGLLLVWFLLLFGIMEWGGRR
jgi:hypothetical protein